MENVKNEGKEVAELGQIASGFVQSNRIIPCEPAPVLSAPVAGAATPVIPKDEAGENGTTPRKHTTCNPLVYEAMRLLEEHGYDADRIISRNGRPVSIVATKGQEELRIAVIRMRKPVPDAKTFRKLKPDVFDQLCAFAQPRQYKTMVWINSPLICWRYYRVDTGGLSYDWDFAKMMKE
jgi:hypothetical protein